MRLHLAEEAQDRKLRGFDLAVFLFSLTYDTTPVCAPGARRWTGRMVGAGAGAFLAAAGVLAFDLFRSSATRCSCRARCSCLNFIRPPFLGIVLESEVSGKVLST